jgi:hypothetical protein
MHRDETREGGPGVGFRAHREFEFDEVGFRIVLFNVSARKLLNLEGAIPGVVFIQFECRGVAEADYPVALFDLEGELIVKTRGGGIDALLRGYGGLQLRFWRPWRRWLRR